MKLRCSVSSRRVRCQRSFSGNVQRSFSIWPFYLPVDVDRDRSVLAGCWPDAISQSHHDLSTRQTFVRVWDSPVQVANLASELHDWFADKPEMRFLVDASACDHALGVLQSTSITSWLIVSRAICLKSVVRINPVQVVD